MAYEWTPETPTYGNRFGFWIEKSGVGQLQFDVIDETSAEGPYNEAAQATLLGQVKDALETAGFTVHPISLIGGASKTLTEV